MAKSTCCGCGLVFSSVRAFERHRAGSYKLVERSANARHCLDTYGMLRAGLLQNDSGVWHVAASKRLAGFIASKRQVVAGPVRCTTSA